MVKPFQLDAATFEHNLYFRVIGRATFNCCLLFREYALKLLPGKFSRVLFHLEQCTGMDSTFMGVLAMICQARIQQNPHKKVEVYGASLSIRHLLDEIGLVTFLEYTDQFTSPPTWITIYPCDQDAKPGVLSLEDGQLILEAHEVLMRISEKNVGKFQQVVNMVREDLQKREQTQ